MEVEPSSFFLSSFFFRKYQRCSLNKHQKSCKIFDLWSAVRRISLEFLLTDHEHFRGVGFPNNGSDFSAAIFIKVPREETLLFETTLRVHLFELLLMDMSSINGSISTWQRQDSVFQDQNGRNFPYFFFNFRHSPAV